MERHTEFYFLCHGCGERVWSWQERWDVPLTTGFGSRQLSFHLRCYQSFIVGMSAGKQGFKIGDNNVERSALVAED